MTKIYLDQDGVLADFNAGLDEFNVTNDTTFLHKPKSEWLPYQIRLDKAVRDCMRTPEFFRNLPLMTGANYLWDMAATVSDSPIVLTARPNTLKEDEIDQAKRVTDEKRGFIHEYFGTVPDSQFICCLRSEKSQYALSTFSNPNCGKPYFGLPKEDATLTDSRLWITEPNILIDDLSWNCSEWTKAGGIAILFKTMDQALADLWKVL